MRRSTPTLALPLKRGGDFSPSPFEGEACPEPVEGAGMGVGGNGRTNS